MVDEGEESVGGRVLNFWSNHPLVDLAAVVAVFGLHIWIVVKFGIGKMLPWSDSPQRLSVYGAGAGMMSLIAGFAGTAVALYASSSGPMAVRLRKKFARVIRRSWVSILSWLLAGALLCIFAMTIESKDSSNFSQWIFEFSSLIAVTKFARLILLFNMALGVSDSDAAKADVKSKKTPQWLPRAPGQSSDQEK
ncbi:hypothetical protein [Amycolatopsis australiensis]|uniref:hypothetical protein n=1 Tax=Amycolatopsis australiensis TaxID=546364 RepID=UPI0011614ED1|nr:hypothetical protein [Amycolatopsis australiensis]